MKTKKRKAQAGDPCPECGLPLRMCGVSGAYVECANRHVFGRKQMCEFKGCRRVATSFIASARRGSSAYCAEHDTWPSGVL